MRTDGRYGVHSAIFVPIYGAFLAAEIDDLALSRGYGLHCFSVTGRQFVLQPHFADLGILFKQPSARCLDVHARGSI